MNGSRKRQSLRTKNEKEAEKKAAELLPVIMSTTKEEIAAHVAVARRINKSRVKIPLKEMWDHYLKSHQRPDSGEVTLKSYLSKVDDFIDWMKKNYPEADHVDQVEPFHVNKYMNHIWDGGVSERTFNTYRQALKLVFRVLCGSLGIDNPFNGIVAKKEDKQSRKEFTEREVARIFAAFDDPKIKMHLKEEMYVVLNICCWTGARGSNAYLMEWSSVDFKRNTITYVPIKTKRRGAQPVTIPLHPQLAAALKKAKKWRKGSKYITPKVAARHLKTPSGVPHTINKFLTELGFEVEKEDKNLRRVKKVVQYSMHSFRHTFVSFCANAGVPLLLPRGSLGTLLRL